jgi:hypothetical protein
MAASKRVLVVCAPGYPGNTEQAKPSMKAFASAAEKAAKWPAGSLEAIYYEKAEPGIERLGQPDAALALVPLPFFLEYGKLHRLQPHLVVVEAGSGKAPQIWSLVAKKGAVTAPEALAGYEIASIAGYSPAFVRGVALAGWGALPGDVSIKFEPAPLSALRRAAAGEKVAVLLDGGQSAALASLPFAKDLEVVTASKPLPGTLLCTVGDRLGAKETASMVEGLRSLPKMPGGPEVLGELRMTGLEPADVNALGVLRADFEKAGPVGK